MTRKELDNAREPDMCHQLEGDVYIGCVPDDFVQVSLESLNDILNVICTALRLSGTGEQKDIARKLVKANLGPR